MHNGRLAFVTASFLTFQERHLKFPQIFVSCHFAVITKLGAGILNLTFTLKSCDVVAQNRIPSQHWSKKYRSNYEIGAFGAGSGVDLDNFEVG